MTRFSTAPALVVFDHNSPVVPRGDRHGRALLRCPVIRALAAPSLIAAPAQHLPIGDIEHEVVASAARQDVIDFQAAGRAAIAAVPKVSRPCFQAPRRSVPNP